MADAILSVSLEAQVANFRAGLVAAAAEAARTGQAVTTATNSISQNVARVNATNFNGFRASLAAGNISLRTAATASTQFSQSIGQLESRLSTLQTALRSATDPATLTRLNAEIRATQNSLGQINRFASTGLLRPLTVGANQAGNALTNLGRVAQDAPFGFIGIQNNLNPLLESFGRLRQETGSNGAALRALGQSLVGPAGLGIALSVVSAAVLFYQQYQQRANKAVKEAKTDADAYVNSLDQVTQAQLKGSKNAQKEITELNTLYAITQDVSLSTKQRGDAVDTLQSKYPEYFKNLSDETILNGNAEAAYKRLATAIIETAKARAAQDLITKNSSRQLENEQKVIDLEAQNIKNRQALIKAQQLESASNQGTSSLTGGAGSITAARKVYESTKLVEDTQKQINNLKTDSNIIDSKNLKLTEAITASIKQGADLTDNATESTGKKFKTLAEILKELDNALKVNEAQYNATFAEKNTGKISAYQSAIDSLITNGYNPAADAVKRLREEQQKLFQLEAGSTTSLEEALNKRRKSQVADPKLVGKASKGVTTPTGSSITRIQAEQEAILKSQQRFNQDMDALVVDGVAGTISNIGSAIGEALMAGGDIFSAAGGALLAGFGQFLDQFGKLLVEYGAAAVLKSKLDAAILIPGAGIFAGAAAIAAGIALQIAAGAIGSLASGKSQGGNKGKNSQPTAFANGGVVFGPTNALIGEYAGARNNPEVVAPLSKLKSMIGGGEQIYIAENVIRGQDIVTIYKKASSTLRRVN